MYILPRLCIFFKIFLGVFGYCHERYNETYMKLTYLTYETGIATFIQFVTLSFLNFINGVDSIVSGFRADDGDGFSNMLVTMIYVMLLVGWFAFLWVLGYAAQDRRSKRLAQVLIAAESLVALISAFNAKHHPSTLGLITSLIDLVLALWVIVLAFRLMRAGGGRVVAKRTGRTRARQRHR